MKKYSLLALSAITAAILTGCGSSDSASGTNVTAERGPILGAVVTDSNGQVAIQKDVNTNVYTFAKTPAYPITVTGGVIDVNGDGLTGDDDYPLINPLTSYTNVITPITNYLGNPEDAGYATKVTALLEAMGDDTLTEADLTKKVASENPLTFYLASAIFKADEDADGGTTSDDAVTNFDPTGIADKTLENMKDDENILLLTTLGITPKTPAEIISIINDANELADSDFIEYDVENGFSIKGDVGIKVNNIIVDYTFQGEGYTGVVKYDLLNNQYSYDVMGEKNTTDLFVADPGLGQYSTDLQPDFEELFVANWDNRIPNNFNYLADMMISPSDTTLTMTVTISTPNGNYKFDLLDETLPEATIFDSLAGNAISVTDSYEDDQLGTITENVTATFFANGVYQEVGTGTNSQGSEVDSWLCHGYWVQLTDLKVGASCEADGTYQGDEPFSPVPNGTVTLLESTGEGDEIIFTFKSTTPAADDTFTVEGKDIDGNWKDTLTIGSIETISQP